MNVLDWCLVALVGIYALSGYWQGFITGAFATAGLLIGGLLGIWAAPMASTARMGCQVMRSRRRAPTYCKNA